MRPAIILLMALLLSACSRSIVRVADGALPDAGARDAGRDADARDAGMRDGGPVDVGGRDAGRDAGPDAGPPEMDVDVVGSWHDCKGSLHLRADGTTVREHLDEGCTSSGTWEVMGRVLTTGTEVTDCPRSGPLPFTSTHVVTRAVDGLVMVNPVSGQVQRLADDAAPRALWQIDGTVREHMGTGASTARVVGTPGTGFGSGCYWSTDGMCGGLFSCSGVIDIWEVRGEGSFSGRTDCSGSCPCGAVLVGRQLDDGNLVGTYMSVNCDRTFTGDFTAAPTPEG